MTNENPKVPTSCPIMMYKKSKKRTSKKVMKVILNIIGTIINLIILLFLSCVIWEVIGHFCPIVPEKVPYFFEFTDKILNIYDGFFKWIIGIFKNIFG